jgi:hypothetical protein
VARKSGAERIGGEADEAVRGGEEHDGKEEDVVGVWRIWERKGV